MYLSVARRPTGSHIGVFPLSSMRPQVHSLNSMLTMLDMLAPCRCRDERGCQTDRILAPEGSVHAVLVWQRSREGAC